MARIFDPRTAFLLLEDQVWAPLLTADGLAAAFAESATGARARLTLADTRYRYPRGRRTDLIPLSRALVDPAV